MAQRWVATIVLALCVLVSGAKAVDGQAVASDLGAAHFAGVRAMAHYGRLPLIFEHSSDLLDGIESFIGHGGGYDVAVSAHGVRFAQHSAHRTAVPTQLALEFLGANPRARIVGDDPQQTRIHRFTRGTDHVARVDRPTYGRVRVMDVYPSVDVVFYGRGHRLEYDVVVEPGGDPSMLRFRVDAGAPVSIDSNGDLLVIAKGASLILHHPVAYQDVDSRRVDVDSAFVVTDAGDVRIRLGRYDPSRTLVIDPVVSYASYLGGSSFDQGTAIAVDAGGNAYVTGHTQSADFPTLSAYDRSLGKNGDVDVFVSKLNSDGTALVWSTYLGGAGSVDRSVGIAVDASGNAYITGQTGSNNFPVSSSAWQKPITGGGTFVTKLGPAGNTLAYSTYVAGVTSQAIAVDAHGNAYVVGSATPAFATTPGSLQPASAASAETGFVLKLNATGTAAAFATYLGGSGSDQATSVAVDTLGNVYVGGWSTSTDFPVLNAYQTTSRGQKDGFVAKLDSTGSRLLFSTLLGGALDDAVNALAVDNNGFAYAAGETYSWNFPSKGGFQPFKAGSQLTNSSVGNAFVAKLAPTGNTLVYSSYLGGEVCKTLCQLPLGPLPQYRADAAYGIAVDPAGHAFVTGIARSYTFPLIDSNALPKQQDNEDSAFIAQVGAAGNTLLWSTFLRTGYAQSDNHWTRFPPGAATGVAVDASGGVYVTGDADSSSNFQPTPGAFQTANTNNQGAVIVKFAATPAMTLTSANVNVDAQAPVTLTATLSGVAASGYVMFMDGLTSLGMAALSSNKATLTTTLPIGIHSLYALFHIPGIATDSPTLLQVVDAPLSCHP